MNRNDLEIDQDNDNPSDKFKQKIFEERLKHREI